MVNNAGMFETRRETTGAGVEMIVATNRPGPFLSTTLDLPALHRGDKARISSLSSAAMYLTTLTLNDTQFQQHPHGAPPSYAESRYAAVDMSQIWSKCRQGP